MSERWENTNWKQCSICEKTAIAEWLPEGIRSSDGCVFIVVSHDCDIANGDLEKEPFIEIFPAKLLNKNNGNFMYGKNPRVLHLKILKTNTPLFVEIEARSRLSIKKEHLRSVNPDENYIIDNCDKRILRDWLVARYRRHAIPDKLHAVLKRGKFWKILEDISAETAQSIQQFRLHYEPDNEIKEGERYELELLIIHDGTEESRHNAEDMAGSLKNAAGLIDEIDLSRCEARSTAEVTMDDLGYYEKLNMDYISHKYDYSDTVED
jgi:hypothetical protein